MIGRILLQHCERARFAPAIRQALLVAAIVGVTAMLARFGLGSVGRLFFTAAGVAAAAYYIKRSPWLYLTVTMWFWTLVPFARRLIDYHAGFDPVNFVLLTPNLMAMLMLKRIADSADLLRLREAGTGALLLFPMVYGLAVSFVQGELVTGVTASIDWFMPLLYYFYMIALAARIEEAEAYFRTFLTLNMTVVTTYGLYQYFDPPVWDATWVIDTGVSTFGIPVPYGLRVFGTLNSPAVLASWLGTLLLLALWFRTRAMVLILPATGLLLLLTQVRSATGCTVLGLFAVLLLGRSGSFKTLVIGGLGMAAVAVVALALAPEIADRVTARFSTVSELGADDSANERLALYGAALDLIEANPLGLGVGTFGRGAVLAGIEEMAHIDSGLLVIYLALGWVAGSIYIAGFAAALVQAFSASRTAASPAALALAACVLAGASSLVFGNMVGFNAACVWLCAGYAAALGLRARRAENHQGVAWERLFATMRASPSAGVSGRGLEGVLSKRDRAGGLTRNQEPLSMMKSSHMPRSEPPGGSRKL